MRSLFAGLILSLIFLAAHQAFADINDYFDTVDAINQHLDDIDSRRISSSCEGASLVMSCGDGICQRDRAENEVNCPADCIDSPVKSYDSAMVCTQVQQYYEPVSLAQVVELVNYAINSHASIRVVGSRHSVNDQYCNDGIIIGTKKLNHILGITREIDGTESVTVEPGVLMGDLAEWLHAKGRSLGYAQLGFRKATVGGAIATGAHGSSLNHTAVISNIVRAVTIVDGQGRMYEINEYRWPMDYLRAVRAHLGMLGAVVKIKLKIVPQFRLHVAVTDNNDSEIMRPNGLVEQVRGCDYVMFNWFPNSHRIVKTCGVQTNEAADPGAENTLLSPPVPSWLTQPYKVALHYGMCYNALNASLEELRYLQLKWIPPFQKADDFGYLTSTSEAIGYGHLMMTSELISASSMFFTNDWEFAVPLSRAQAALSAVSRYAEQTHMRLPLIGVFLRFAPSEDLSLMAHTTSVGSFPKGEPVVFFEFPTPAPVGLSPQVTRAINGIYENLARLLMIDFGARPHWGKNQDFAFALANQLQTYGDNLARFQEIKDHLDPFGLFMTDFDINAGFH